MACVNRLESEHQRELAFTARLAAKLAVEELEDATFQPIIGYFVWNLTEKNLKAIQAALSYPFSRQQIYQMLTSIATSATTTTAHLLPKLCAVVGRSPSAIVNSNRSSPSSSTEDIYEETSESPVILKSEPLAFAYPLESLFGITIESLLGSGDCSFDDSLGEDNLYSSELADIVVEEVYQQVNNVMKNCLLKVNTASSPCFLYFCPDDFCTGIGELLIRTLVHKLRVLHCYISHGAAATAIGTVLGAIESQVPSAVRQSKSVEATNNIIEYILEAVILAWLETPNRCSRTQKSGHVPILHPTVESIESGLSLILMDSDPSSGSDAAKTTTFFDSLMTARYMSKCSGHFSSHGFTASDRLHQRLGDLINCALQCKENSDSDEARTATKDFLHYFVEELVQRLFVTSTFPCPATLPENSPVMPFNVTEEDFGLTVVDLLTELVVSQVFYLLSSIFPPANPIERILTDVSVQEEPPKLTFMEKLKIMKSNVLGKIKKAFRFKRASTNKDNDDDEEATPPKPKKTRFSGFTISFTLRMNSD